MNTWNFYSRGVKVKSVLHIKTNRVRHGLFEMSIKNNRETIKNEIPDYFLNSACRAIYADAGCG
jgi:hypothetical protein